MNTIDNTANTSAVLWLSPQALAWARENGSAFLRFWAEEGDAIPRHLYAPEHETGLRLPIERGGFCRRRYNQERAQKEAPGWSLLDEQAFQPLYPPAEAMELLVRAKEQFPKARLRQIFRRDCVEFVIVADAPWPDGMRLVFNDRLVVALKDD